ncbi:MAG TPA: hypothetical protein VIR78_09470 [Malonomonas sp.]
MSEHRIIGLSAVFLLLLLLCPWTEATAAGDPSRGAALFVGSSAFENGGAPCLACHSLSGVGISDGANYGPDLSRMYEDFGEEGVAAVLGSLEFPSMAAIYTSRPLTETEQADLVAYFAQTSQLSVTPDDGKLALLVAVGVAIILAFTFVIGRRRMQAVRQPLVERQRNLLSKGGLQ